MTQNNNTKLDIDPEDLEKNLYDAIKETVKKKLPDARDEVLLKIATALNNIVKKPLAVGEPKTLSVGAFAPSGKRAKDFVAQHKVQRNHDANGNDDDVFQASNIDVAPRPRGSVGPDHVFPNAKDGGDATDKIAQYKSAIAEGDFEDLDKEHAKHMQMAGVHDLHSDWHHDAAHAEEEAEGEPTAKSSHHHRMARGHSHVANAYRGLASACHGHDLVESSEEAETIIREIRDAQYAYKQQAKQQGLLDDDDLSVMIDMAADAFIQLKLEHLEERTAAANSLNNRQRNNAKHLISTYRTKKAKALRNVVPKTA